MKPSSLQLVRDGNEMSVVDGDAVLMRLRQADLFFAGQFMIEDVRFHPRCPTRIRILNPCWLGIVPPTTPQRVRVAEEKTHRGLRIRLDPETPGPVHVDDVYEFVADPDSGGWMIDHHCRLTFRHAVPAHELGLHVMPDPKGVPTMHWEFDYHIPFYGAGPSVPMREDWRGVFEPTLGPDTFRKPWQRAVTHFIFQPPSGGMRSIRFHRGLLCAMQYYHRDASAVRRGGFAGFVCRDGAGVLLELRDRKPLHTIICQWANDIHFRRPLAGDPERLVLRKGHVLEASYRLREMPAERMKGMLRSSRPLAATAEERKRVDRLPIYEEPVNRFATSWADDPTGNAFAWVPGNGAVWDRKVGRRTPGSLKLTATLIGFCYQEFSWKSCPVGPTTFMNPLVPKARYRLSGYVRVRPSDSGAASMDPSLSITFRKHAGFATFAPEIEPAEVFRGGVVRVRNPRAMRWNPDHWYKIEVVSGPITGNVLSATLGCHLRGNGEAWFDELAFEKVQAG